MGIFKKKPKMIVNFNGIEFTESKILKKHRLGIVSEFESMIKKIDVLSKDKSIPVEQRYVLMVAVFNMMSDNYVNLLANDKLFTNEYNELKQREDYTGMTNKYLNGGKTESPYYIG